MLAPLTVRCSRRSKLNITGIDGTASQSENAQEPVAQIILWSRATKKIQQKIILNIGETTVIECPVSIIIVLRILKKREKMENPCPPRSSPDDDLTVHFDDRQVTVSASWLMSVSPVVHRMLSVEMKEKQQRTLNLDGLGINMEQSAGPLSTAPWGKISRAWPKISSKKTIFRRNVLTLLKLADYFQVDWLKERCDTHLVNCLEIPLVDRFLLIEPYKLNKLKQLFARFFATSDASG
ncbi:hypothetical protein GPALN_012071 [Globodera pallida]|nr:hypothetical protein GPALN_012071 [Globodera pallida]